MTENLQLNSDKKEAFTSHTLLRYNIPSKILYALIDSKILHFARTTADLINMVTSVNFLMINLRRQGSECVCINSLLKNTFGKYFKVFHKLNS